MEPALDRREWMSFSLIRPISPQLMKTSFAPTPKRSSDSQRARRITTPVTDYSYKSAVSATAAPLKAQKLHAELTNFRALSRSFFGVEAGREHLKEGIMFAFMMVIAAWPLGVTLHMLGTMMISPPPWIINGVSRFIG